jgi:adenylate cyclase
VPRIRWLDGHGARLAHAARERPVAAALLVAGCVGACMALLGATAIGLEFETGLGLPTLYRARGARAAPPRVLVVAMDNASAGQIHLPRDDFDGGRCDRLSVGPSAPAGSVSLPPPRSGQWPRCLHGRLLDALVVAGARVVAFDLLFRPRPGVRAGEDAEFAEALARFPGGLIAEEWLRTSGDDCDGLRVSPTSAALLDAAAGSGPFLLDAPGEQGGRTDRWLSFGGCPPGQPTLPLLAWAAFWRDGFADALVSAGEAPPGRASPAATLLVLRSARETGRPLGRPASEPARRLGDGASVPDSVWFNLYGPPGTLPRMTYDEVLLLAARDPAALAKRVNGAAVWVGYADYRQPDQYEHFHTASPGRGPTGTSGVELAATAFANLLDGSAVHPPGAPWRALLGAATAALCVGAGALLSVWLGLAAAAALAAAWGLAATFAFREWAAWWPVAVPLYAAMPAGLLAGAGLRFLITTLHRELFRRAVEKVLPADVVKAFGEPGAAFSDAGEDVECVCLATDAQGFTTRAEQVPASEMRRQLNAYFEVIFRPVQGRGGFISDVVGDAVLALWPVRRDPLPVVAQQVFAAALEAQRAGAAADGFLPTRLGIAFGRVSLGPVGALGHYEYRAVGDAVNVSNRVEQLNKELGTTILVADPPEGVAGFLLRDLGAWPVRGRSASVRLFELVAAERDVTPEQRDLMERFGRGRALLDRGEIFLARQVFEALARDYPEDQPTRSILERWGH